MITAPLQMMPGCERYFSGEGGEGDFMCLTAAEIEFFENKKGNADEPRTVGDNSFRYCFSFSFF